MVKDEDWIYSVVCRMKNGQLWYTGCRMDNCGMHGERMDNCGIRDEEWTTVVYRMKEWTTVVYGMKNGQLWCKDEEWITMKN